MKIKKINVDTHSYKFCLVFNSVFSFYTHFDMKIWTL